MPDEWRRALLGGVLGSLQQVQFIIEKFREDPKIMMAGARQLYLHGPSYIFGNKNLINSSFEKEIKNFDFLKKDWGFIAGTCFWIRTSILKELASCEIKFQHGEYTVDGSIAHAIERMFGMKVAIAGGKVLLQDLTLPERMPDVLVAYPSYFPKKPTGLISQLLTPLVANGFIDVKKSKPIAIGEQKEKNKRIAVFASYSEDGMLPLQVVPYIKGLQEVAETIVFVCDNELFPHELKKIKGMVKHVITGKHGEYDFGSYKRGIAWVEENGYLNKADDLILCNDSCFGPINSFVPIFKVMDARSPDFWGVTDSSQYSYHLQSYFIVFSKKVFESKVFLNFIKSIKKQENVQSVILNYEIGLTKILQDAGFKPEAFVKNNLVSVHEKDTTYSNSPILPLYTVTRGSPLIKVKSIKYPHMNLNGVNDLLHWLKKADENLYEIIVSDINTKNYLNADNIKFSLILATYNRAHCIGRAIRSVLCQSHRNFEIIVVDDGSTDNTKELIDFEFKDSLENGRIRYIRLEKNLGVCAARNIGLAYAQNPWIGYVDSDNTIRPYMLKVFANTIVKNPEKESFYAKFFRLSVGSEVGRSFDRAQLVNANFIDLGVYVHSRSLAQRCGAFDQNLRRLVDWEMIIRHTKTTNPVFIPRICLDYEEDSVNLDRISVRESVVKALTAVRARHNPKPTVSSIIVSYNHEEFITEAIESALQQQGDFNHEILLADDGSTDKTPEIIANYVKKYPKKIRSIGRGRNFGVSDNYRHSFSEAEGNFIAILEGDDYWSDNKKLFKQASFLEENKKVSMVFSGIEIFDMKNNSRRCLDRQKGVPKIISAKNFADDQHLNLIVNLSCCMFRSAIMKRLPETLYHPRLSEIALAFYHDTIGGIGFLSEVMSTYRLNNQSVWTGASAISQHQQAIAVRECAIQVARPIYREKIQQHIDQRRKMLQVELDRQASFLALSNDSI